jgi:hypothetical protein
MHDVEQKVDGGAMVVVLVVMVVDVLRDLVVVPARPS